jgi:hypothetical protein
VDESIRASSIKIDLNCRSQIGKSVPKIRYSEKIKKINPKMQNCVDIEFVTASISCTKDATRTLAWVAFGFRVPEVCKGKSFNGGTFTMATKKKAKKKKH